LYRIYYYEWKGNRDRGGEAGGCRIGYWAFGRRKNTICIVYLLFGCVSATSGISCGTKTYYIILYYYTYILCVHVWYGRRVFEKLAGGIEPGHRSVIIIMIIFLYNNNNITFQWRESKYSGYYNIHTQLQRHAVE